MGRVRKIVTCDCHPTVPGASRNNGRRFQSNAPRAAYPEECVGECCCCCCDQHFYWHPVWSELAASNNRDTLPVNSTQTTNCLHCLCPKIKCNKSVYLPCVFAVCSRFVAARIVPVRLRIVYDRRCTHTAGARISFRCSADTCGRVVVIFVMKLL